MQLSCPFDLPSQNTTPSIDVEESSELLDFMDSEDEIFEYVDPNEGEDDCADALESEGEEEVSPPFWYNAEERGLF